MWILGWGTQATTDLAQKVETRPIQRVEILEDDQLLLYYYFIIIIDKSRVNVKHADGLTVTLQSTVASDDYISKCSVPSRSNLHF